MWQIICLQSVGGGAARNSRYDSTIQTQFFNFRNVAGSVACSNIIGAVECRAVTDGKVLPERLEWPAVQGAADKTEKVSILLLCSEADNFLARLPRRYVFAACNRTTLSNKVHVPNIQYVRN